MVTHDSRYAHFAKRTINLFDGEVVESSIKEHVNKATADTREVAELIPRELSAETGA
jgi:putative ABC transport system ATP-binding protein